MSSNAADIAKVSAKGGFNVLWGLIVSSIISAVGVIFIARLLGSDAYGLYTIAITAPNLILIFRDWGITYAMIRFTAKYRAEGRMEEVRSVLFAGLVFEFASGLVLCILSLALSDFIATNIFNRPALAPIMQLASFYILASAMISAASAAFTGLERMALNSIMNICQSIIKTVLIISLVIIGLGTQGAVIGLVASTTIAGLIGLVLLFGIYRSLPKPVSLSMEIKEYLKEMLRYGIPLSLAVIIASFMAQYYMFLLPVFYSSDNTLIGNYGIAQSFIIIIGFFSTPITTMMFPAFSKLDHNKDRETLKRVYQFSVKYASMLVVPVVAIVMALSEPGVSALFGSSYTAAPLFLAMLAIGYSYAALGNLSTSNLINSQGHTKFILKITILTACIGIPLGTVLVLNFGVIGLIVTSLVEALPSHAISLYWIRKKYGVTVDWGSSAKIVLSSAVAALVTYGAISAVSFNNWLELLLGAVVFLPTVVLGLLLTRVITSTDISNLRTVVGGLGLLGRLVDKILTLVEKVMPKKSS
ncbi:oligosaccharide flippase family protein [Candidatus Bathyarchaeota archaeon]|nr:oligosaccharide flippase family protein [Candidatus Bathyarchaeota archaeon]